MTRTVVPVKVRPPDQPDGATLNVPRTELAANGRVQVTLVPLCVQAFDVTASVNPVETGDLIVNVNVALAPCA